MQFPDTWRPYRKIERDPIQYTYCLDFGHISRYAPLRQVIHQGNHELGRYMALETTNPFNTSAEMNTFVVPFELENRLDLIAYEQLGSASYAWIIAYINKISDGYTVLEGTILQIPTNVYELFNKGEILGTVSAVKLNLGSE